jgi:hypothetical protein
VVAIGVVVAGFVVVAIGVVAIGVVVAGFVVVALGVVVAGVISSIVKLINRFLVGFDGITRLSNRLYGFLLFGEGVGNEDKLKLISPFTVTLIPDTGLLITLPLDTTATEVSYLTLDGIGENNFHIGASSVVTGISVQTISIVELLVKLIE